jgi:hypothetical protein
LHQQRIRTPAHLSVVSGVCKVTQFLSSQVENHPFKSVSSD